jgi:hypothetical protein
MRLGFMRRFDAYVGARILIEKCLNVGADDDVLVVTSTNLFSMFFYLRHDLIN